MTDVPRRRRPKIKITEAVAAPVPTLRRPKRKVTTEDSKIRKPKRKVATTAPPARPKRKVVTPATPKRDPMEARPPSRHKNEILPPSKMKRSKKFEGCWEAPQDSITGIKANPRTVIAGTVVIFDKDRHYKQMFTTLPDGSGVGWDNCSACHALSLTVCNCTVGYSTSRCVELFYDKANARLAGEEWDHHHPNYYGSILKADRRRSGPSHEEILDKIRARVNAQTAAKTAPAPVVTRTVKRPQAATSGQPRRPKRKSTAPQPAVAEQPRRPKRKTKKGG